MAPGRALEHWARRDVKLMAPTFRSLEELAALPDADAVLTAARTREIRPVLPVVRREGGRTAVTVPGQPDFVLTKDGVVP
ncbi:hypothetical protein BJF78_10340 [Pseudonocardia sp. CNS-139]|nr:hypothetical protein BJF78_10340 [Pseudonocardia sp. CNS-139]